MNPHGIATAPSRQRVYQFHHLDAKRVLTRKGRVWQAKNDGFAKFVSSLCHSGEKLACSRDCKAHNTRSGSQGTDSGQILHMGPVPCPVPFPVPFASCTGPGNAHALRWSPFWLFTCPQFLPYRFCSLYACSPMQQGCHPEPAPVCQKSLSLTEKAPAAARVRFFPLLPILPEHKRFCHGYSSHSQ